MSNFALESGLITEQTIMDALSISKGDIFLASRYLKVTARQLDSHIRISPALQQFCSNIETIKTDPAYNQLSQAQFQSRLQHMQDSMKIEALEIIHGLASMTYDSAAMAEVKLKAAKTLLGDQSQGNGQSNYDGLLDELNRLYKQSAPRIKQIRVAQIEFKEGGVE